MSLVIETTIGDITIDLYTKSRPRTCLNFLKLAKTKYYNFSLFHKVQRDFIAQTGDPTGTGKGGESIFCHLYGEQGRYFEGEIKPKLKHDRVGLISMVNGVGPEETLPMHASQFFITLADSLDYLDTDKHTVFGEVAEGMDVVGKLNETICDEEGRPYQDIRITHMVILEDPFDDPADLSIPQSPEITREFITSNRIGVDEDIDDTEGKTVEEIEEEIRDREAKEKALVLEMIGDIPDADIKPPENVLFVCKLNPVTSDEDLEVIFSRFGHIVSCEVIKDQKTGESLQYAFIEFEKEEDCEKAYFKMDNVLIDDRRIHVDFSQSVSKITWHGKGRGVTYADGNADKKSFGKFDGDKSSKNRNKFEIKKGALGERTDRRYDFVYDEEEDKSGGRDRTSGRLRDQASSKESRPSERGRDERRKDSSRDRFERRNRSRSRERFHERDSGRKDNKRHRSRSKSNERQRGREYKDRDNRRRDDRMNRESKRESHRDRDRDKKERKRSSSPPRSSRHHESKHSSSHHHRR